MISEIYILFFKASLTIRHTASVSQKKSGTSKKIQWDFQISRVGSLDFLDLKVNGSPDFIITAFLNLIFLVKFNQFNTNFFVIHSSFSTLLPCAEMASAFVLNSIYLMKFN